ncbi:ABC transporter permease [Photobacterium indicum]|uniref:ABC transporter permease n=1 Tax=Photobacterium indicum TaxID=81447 RepID=A0A2T3L5L6_9GAMM|nr:FtsX-like permease family protein [Photobacterium indicum]PSV45197.1 ABC transporter permease [Photobacterium indicum]
MLIKLAWRNLWRNKLRTSIMLFAMVFGLIGVASMIGFMNGMYGNMIDNAIAWQTSNIQIHRSEYINEPEINDTIIGSEQIIEQLRDMPDVSAWSARFIADGMVASARSTRGVKINGIDLEAEAKVTPLVSHIIEGEWLSEQGRNPVLVSSKTAERLRLRVGSKVVLTFTDAANDVSGAAFRVRGIFKSPSSSFDDGNVYVRRSDLSALAHIDGVHEIAIVVNEATPSSNIVTQAVKAQLQTKTSKLNTIRDWQQIQPMMATMIKQTGTSTAIILGIFVSAMGLGIVNIMLMSVFERTREFGVLMAVGMQKHKVFLLIMLETSLLGMSGALLGVGICAVLMMLLQTTGISLNSMAEGLGAFGVDTTIYPRMSFGEYQLIFLTVVAASFLAALYPARQILKQRPADAMAEKH